MPQESDVRPFIRRAALLLTFLTGFSGLVYEVVWQRYLVNFLGSQARASALILAVFLGGLSGGYLLFGKFSKGLSSRTAVRICGWAEVGIGAWALAFPALYKALWNAVGIAPHSSVAGDIMIAIALMGIPTVLMGGTLPLLTQGLSRDLADSAVYHARIYAVNTGGAFLGCLSGGFILLPVLGLPLSMMCMALVNIAAGFLLIGIGSLLSPKMEDSTLELVAQFDRGELARGAAIAFLAGFYSISLETVLIRLTGLSLGSSEYTFAMIISAFILMLALGAATLGRERGPRQPLAVNQLIVVCGLVLVSMTVPCWPYAVHVLRTLFASVPPAFYAYYLLVFAALLCILALPLGAMGCTMPLLFAELKKDKGSLGRAVGILYGVNTLGCVAGALVGGYLLLFYLDLDSVFRLCALLAALSILLVRPVRPLIAGTALILAAALWVFVPWDPLYFALGTFRQTAPLPSTYEGKGAFYKQFAADTKLMAYKDDPNTSVAVIEDPLRNAEAPRRPGNTFSRSLIVNGKSDGNTIGGDLRNTLLLGHLPALFQSSTSSEAAVIGFGTGITAGSLLAYPEFKRIDCFEISPFVRSFSNFFSFANGNAADDPRLHWAMNDAYRALGSSRSSYAVIVSEPSNPWIVGVERLYSLEFLDIAKKRLAPGGIYAQWLQQYSLSERTLGLVLNTFQKSFRHVRIFRTDYDLILLGSEEDIGNHALNLAMQRIQHPRVAEDMRDAQLPSLASIMGLEFWLPSSLFKRSGYQTLEYPRLAFEAGRDFFANASVNLTALIDRPALRQAIEAYGERSLIYHVKDELNAHARENFLAAACNGTAPYQIEATSRLSRPCRGMIMASLAAGDPSPVAGSAIDEQVLLFLVGRQSAVPPLTVREVRSAIRLYNLFATPLAPLSQDRLSQLTVQCASGQDTESQACAREAEQARRLPSAAHATGPR